MTTLQTFTPGTLIDARKRLWRVDQQVDSTLYVTAVDENTVHSVIYLPIEQVTPSNISSPDLETIGSVQAQKLMLNAFRLSMMNSTARLRCLQHSRAIPVPYQLVPVEDYVQLGDEIERKNYDL